VKTIEIFGTRIEVTFPLSHTVCRFSAPREYGNRLLVPDDMIIWEVPFDGYFERRTNYVSPHVLENFPNGWAHAPDPRAEASRIRSYGELRFNDQGYPMNPVGRTGFGPERGRLGHWGGNFSADPMITWVEPHDNLLRLLVIERSCGKLAFPGGMDEYGETTGGTLNKELGEETGIKDLEMEKGEPIYCGYVDDPRNSDHAWMETIVCHRHIEYEVTRSWKIRAGSDAIRAFPVKVTKSLLNSMYANHGKLVKLGMKSLAKREPKLKDLIEQSQA
jgi:ADP-ribose pyrophosphatase